MLQLLQPDSSKLPCLYSTFHLEYPLVLEISGLLKIFEFKHFVFSIFQYGEVVEGLAVDLLDRSLFKDDKQATSSISDSTCEIIVYTMFDIVEHSIDPEDSTAIRQIEIQTENIHPGYARLHSPLFYKQTLLVGMKYVDKVPFLTHTRKATIDITARPTLSTAFACKDWPIACFSSWIERERSSGWPDGELLAKAQSTELLLLPRSHPQSEEPEVEWRVCFGPAEEILASSLTKWQKYCFHVLQVLVKAHVEEGKVVQLYYLKTIFFYALEIVPKDKWENQLGICLLHLLDRVIIAFRNRSLPHYFIPQNNLIDHLDEDICKNVVAQLEAIRQFPVISVILVAEGHGLTSSWVADPIIEDIPRFHGHKNIRISVQQAFVPTVIRDVQNDISFQLFRSATKSFMDAFTEFSRGHKGIMLPFDAFLHQSLNGIVRENQWWFCFFLDLFHKTTNSLHSVFRHEGGVTMCELLGSENDAGAGPLYAIKIPHPLIGSSAHCKKYGPKLGFLNEMCIKLLSQKAYDLATIYGRILISLIRKNIAEIAASENRYSETSNEKDDNISQIQKRSTGFPEIAQAKKTKYFNHMQITNLNTLLYAAYLALYTCYVSLQQPELFTEYVEDMEQLCDTMPSRDAYNNLADIMWNLGCDEKYDEAMAKARNCSEGHNTFM